jgi:hypothetical protein
VLFEFDATGLDVRARHDVQAGGMLGGEAMSYSPIDLRESLVRAYAPLDQVEAAQARLSGILGHSNFEVIAIEALDALPQQGMTGSTRLATYSGLQQLQDDFVRVQQMYAEAAGSGQTIDVEYLLRHMHGQ